MNVFFLKLLTKNLSAKYNLQLGVFCECDLDLQILEIKLVNLHYLVNFFQQTNKVFVKENIVSINISIFNRIILEKIKALFDCLSEEA